MLVYVSWLYIVHYISLQAQGKKAAIAPTHCMCQANIFTNMFEKNLCSGSSEEVALSIVAYPKRIQGVKQTVS